MDQFCWKIQDSSGNFGRGHIMMFCVLSPLDCPVIQAQVGQKFLDLLISEWKLQKKNVKCALIFNLTPIFTISDLIILHSVCLLMVPWTMAILNNLISKLSNRYSPCWKLRNQRLVTVWVRAPWTRYCVLNWRALANSVMRALKSW